ncbi:MAG: YcxB family protein [Vulcanimicrobiota bacterium]
MELKTKQFQLNAKKLAVIMAYNFYRKFYYLPIAYLAFLVAAYYSWGQQPAISIFFIIMAVVIPLYNQFRIKQQVKHYQQAVGLARHHVEFTEDFMISVFEDGRKDKVPWKNIKKIDKGLGLYMFFLSPYTCIFIPVTAFKKREDIFFLLSLIKNKIKDVDGLKGF